MSLHTLLHPTPKSSPWLVALILAACVLTACTPALATPPPDAATPTPRAARPTAPPTYTAAPFELRPTGTRPPTETSFVFGLASTLIPDLETPTGLPAGFNPLTGLQVDDASRLERRPLLVKISNFPRSVRTHQWGLNTADHVWEYYLEDELTRFVGVYYGTDAERVGPVRSARPFDEHLLHMYKGILTFAYADKRLMDQWVADPKISPFMVIQKPDNCPPMCRIGPKNDYNTLYTDTSLLSRYVSERGTSNGRQALSGLHFEAGDWTAAGGGAAQHVEIRFSAMSYHYWEYQPATRRYLRWQDGDRLPAGEEVYTPLLDSQNGQQVAADNILILFVPTGYIYVSTSTEVHQHNLAGSGMGYAIRDGRIFEIQWRRERPKDLISVAHANGKPYLLKPGSVWYEVLSPETQTMNAIGAWKFVYRLPGVPTITPKVIPTATP